MLDWRARIGLLVPSANVIIEPEFNLMAPPGVVINATRMNSGPTQVAVERLNVMAANARRGISELSGAEVDVMLLAEMSVSMVLGREWEQSFKQDLQKETGIPLITAAATMIEALQAIGAKRVAFACPYPDEKRALVQPYFESAGFAVASAEGYGGEEWREPKKYPELTYKLAKKAYRKDADALVILTTDVRSVDMIARLEEDLGIPVISSNIALFWKALRMCNLALPVTGFGSLLRDH